MNPGNISIIITVKMQLKPIVQLASIILIFALLSGCSTPIARPTFVASDGQAGFEQIVNDPSSHVGKRVVVGGALIGITRLDEGGTGLEMLELPLKRSLKPNIKGASRGRFIVKSAHALDEAIFRKGRLITFVGEVIGAEERPVGQTTYNYPVLKEVKRHLWTKEIRSWPSPTIGIGIGK